MNKKTISMIAMVATIVYAIMYLANQIYSSSYYIHFGMPMSLTYGVTTILRIFLSVIAFIFIALFFKSNYMDQDSRKISLVAAIFMFTVTLSNIGSNLLMITYGYSGTIFIIWNSLYNIFTITMGVFFIFNYLKKSKKLISLVITIIIGLLLIPNLYFFFDSGYNIVSVFNKIAYLFYLISLILFFITVFKSEKEFDYVKPEPIKEKPVTAPIKKSVSTLSNDKKENLSIGEWMLMMLLVSIPIVGLVMLLVWAFESNPHPIKSNWAKANLIWGLIMMFLSLFIILIVVLATIM